MATAPKRAKGRSIKDFPNLTVAEKKLLKACREGEVARFGEKRPEKGTLENTIRPGLIRFLVLGGDDQNPVHDLGIRVIGAWFSEGIDLSSCDCPTKLKIMHCHVAGKLEVDDAKFREINFGGSLVDGLSAEHTFVAGTVFLNNGFRSTDEVSMLRCNIEGSLELSDAQVSTKKIHAISLHRARIGGSLFFDGDFRSDGSVEFPDAVIGGNLDCGNGRFNFNNAQTPNSETALILDRATIQGNVNFNEKFRAAGVVSMFGCRIRGNWDCRGGEFTGGRRAVYHKGPVALHANMMRVQGDVYLDQGFKAEADIRLLGCQIEGDLCFTGGTFGTSKNDDALTLTGMVVAGSLYLDEEIKIHGKLDLAAARVGNLIDSVEKISEEIVLDGFTYDRFLLTASTQAKKRIAWLMKQQTDHLGQGFRPQPWEQVIKVFREMGHQADAREVAIAKQNQMRIANKVGDFPLRQFHWLYGLLAGYGYEPLRAVFAMVQVFLLCALFYQITDSYGIMGPSSPIIHNSSIAETCGKPVGNLESTWTACADMPKEYTTFSAFWYSADLILPLVNLQQDTDWSPMVTRSNLEYDGTSDYIALGVAARLIMWFEILFGWAASLLLVAVLGNLVKKD